MPIETETGSTLVARLGYNSNVVANNISFGFNQFGISPGISYYHKSGLYLDVTAYWSQEYLRSFYLTVPSVGFLKSIKKYTLNLEYSHYLFTPTDSTLNNPYDKYIGLANFLKIKPFLFRLDYSFYFGSNTAHRIVPAISLNLEKKNWHKINRILFYPTFSVLFGNETWQLSQYVPYTKKLAEIVYRIRHNLPLYYLQTDTNNKFGLLNYVISVPTSISIKDWTFILSYTYNFPRTLPNDQQIVYNSGYVAFSVIRNFNFKSKTSLIDFYKLQK